MPLFCCGKKNPAAIANLAVIARRFRGIRKRIYIYVLIKWQTMHLVRIEKKMDKNQYDLPNDKKKRCERTQRRGRREIATLTNFNHGCICFVAPSVKNDTADNRSHKWYRIIPPPAFRSDIFVHNMQNILHSDVIVCANLCADAGVYFGCDDNLSGRRKCDRVHKLQRRT